jgi:hypothetical protein
MVEKEEVTGKRTPPMGKMVISSLHLTPSSEKQTECHRGLLMDKTRICDAQVFNYRH